MWEEMLTICREQDSFRAIALVESSHLPLYVAQRYSQLIQDLYRRAKDMPLMLMIGRAGVQYALLEARRYDSGDPQLARQLRELAKTMSYNLSANCWPAWEEPGIAITHSELEHGHDLARLNLHLAHELQVTAEKIAMAYWLLGAHQLAAKETPQAVDSFEQAVKLYEEAAAIDSQHMSLGYVGIARMQHADSRSAGQQQLEAALAALATRDTDDSRFFAQQLASVAQFFEASISPGAAISSAVES